MENQFINAPLLVNRSAQLDSKDELIKKLEIKNNKLKTQLIKIQRTIEQKFTTQEDEQLPKKRESIFQTEDNYEVLTKELANTYKRIKMYEYEISKLEDANRSVNLSQKSTQIDQIVKEKRQMAEKLKQQLHKEKRIVQENIKRLEKNNEKNEMEAYIKKLTEEAKFFKEKIKFLEQQEATKALNMKKQYEAIKKCQNQLLEAGVAGGQLQDIKRNSIKSISIGQSPRQLNETQKEAGMSGSEEEVEDRTRQRYQMLLGEVVVLERMQKDHERQMIQAFQDKIEALNKNMNSRNRLLECQNEIENLQKEIQVIKSRVVPSNMKPLRPIRSVSSHQPQKIQKLLPAKSIGSSIVKNKGFNHLLKYDEVGFPSNKGQRFTDRLVLGKTNLTAKITGVKVYLDTGLNLIAGLQCTYSGNKRGGDHVRKDKDQREKQYKEEQFSCRGSSFIRSICGTLNADDKLQFLQLTSSDGSSFRVGVAISSAKSFTLEIGPDEYPTCVFGSLVVEKQPGKKEHSYVQHIGFQVQGDSMNTNSSVINQFDL